MKFFKIISTFLLAFLVLASSSSFTIAIHRCCGRIKNISFFTEAERCEIEQGLAICHQSANTLCCEDQTVIHKAQDCKIPLTSIHLDLLTTLDMERPLVLISNIIQPAIVSYLQCSYYDPPRRTVDRTVVQRTFLI